MAVLPCTIVVNDKKQELSPHGTPMFPCGCYDTYIDRTVTGNVAWHWHEELELIMIHQGEAQISAGQRSYLLQTGEGIFINSNVLHSGRGIGPGQCILHSFVFHSSLLCGSMDNIFQQKYISPLTACPELPSYVLKKNIDWQKQVLENILKAFDIFQKEDFGYEFTIRELLTETCMQIVKNNRQFLLIQTEDSTSETNRIKVMLNYIHQHYPEAMELKHIADCVNISVRECLRCFHEILGISPMQYLIKYRISTSAQLLADTNQNITEICIQCGFPSPSYFSKMFKRYTGTTPSEYRRQF